MAKAPTPWKQGDPFSAAHLNETVDAIRAIGGVQSGSEGTTDQVGNQKFINYNIKPFAGAIYFGKIVTAGPKSEADYTDYRYWVQFREIFESGSSTAALQVGDGVNPFDTETGIVTVCNVGEFSAETHLLPEGSMVQIYPYMEVCGDKGNTAVRWLMYAAPFQGGLVPVSLTVASGSNGNVSTSPSWLYNGTNLLTGEAVLSSAAPQVGRNNGNFISASYGLAYQNEGTWSLFYAFELPETDSCLSI